MVTITDFAERQSGDGEKFNALIVQSGMELIKSQESGNYYVTARKASIPCTFNAETCKGLIGKKLKGTVEKVECEPYQYQIPGTEEQVVLKHTYIYNPEVIEAEMEEEVLEKELS